MIYYYLDKLTATMSLKKLIKKNRKLAGLVFLLAVLPMVVVISQQVTKLRPKAAPEIQEPYSWLELRQKGDKKLFVGEEFEIDVVLVAERDHEYVITGVDALIDYKGDYSEGVSTKNIEVNETEKLDSQFLSPGLLEPIEIKNGNVFESLTQQNIDKRGQQIRISGSNSKLKDEKGYPVGFSNQREMMATIKFKAIRAGNVQLSFNYQGASATSDTNIVGFEKNRPVNSQVPKERLMHAPKGQSVYIAKTAPPPVSPHPKPSPSPRPRPEAKLQLELSLLERVEIQPGPKPIPLSGRPESQFLPPGKNYLTTGTLYGVDAGEVKGVMIASQFGDLLLEKQPDEWIGPPPSEQILPQPVPKPIPEPEPKKPSMVKLASFTTDSNGQTLIAIPQEYEGKRMYLFVRTPSHLLKAGNKPIALPSVPECLYTEPFCAVPMVMPPPIKFENLMPGDIYIAEGQTEQDNMINTFDAIELIKYLGEPVKIAMPDYMPCFKEPCEPTKPTTYYHKADLNGDMVVNTRDLKILLGYMGKKGDEVVSKEENCVNVEEGKKCCRQGLYPQTTKRGGYVCAPKDIIVD